MSAPNSSKRTPTREKGAICFEFERDGDLRRARIDQQKYPTLDAIEQTRPTGRDYTDELPPCPLPGSGSEEADCGEDMPALFCPGEGCGKVHWVGRTCRRSRCPRCWRAWNFYRAQSLAGQIDADAAAKYVRGQQNIKKHHLTISFRSSTRFNSDDPLQRAVDAVKALLQQCNVESGALVYHPWRIAEEYRGDIKGHSSGSGDMTWKDVIAKIEGEDWSWAAVRDEFLVHEPHFHAIVTSTFVQGGEVTRELEAETGVVIERITEAGDSNVSVANEDEALARVVAYCLSHAGLRWDEDNEEFRAAVWRFGEAATRTPSAGIQAAIDEALREVAPDVLGVEFPVPECDADQPDLDDDHDHHCEDPGCGGGSAGPAFEDTTGVDLSGLDTVSVGGGGSDGGWSDPDNWAASAGHAPGFAEDPTEAERTVTCGTSLRPMWAVDEFLESDTWVDQLPDGRERELREARSEWVAEGKPDPMLPAEPPPPDDE